MTELDQLEDIVGSLESIEPFGIEPDFSSLGLEPAEVLGFQTEEELENAIKLLTKDINHIQSLLINIGVIIIGYIFQIFLNPFGNLLIIRTLTNTLFISLFLIIIYCVWFCIQGNEPNLPGISQATKMQL